MAACGDDAGGHLEEALALEMRRQGLAAVEAAAMEIAPAVGEQARALAPGGGAAFELDLGESGVERLDGGRDEGLHPERRRGDPEAAGAPGERRRHHLLAVLDVAQDAARVPDHPGAEPGRTDARGMRSNRLPPNSRSRRATMRLSAGWVYELFGWV